MQRTVRDTANHQAFDTKRQQQSNRPKKISKLTEKLDIQRLLDYF